jgi:hypothetical protein
MIRSEETADGSVATGWWMRSREQHFIRAFGR